ncbi:MAG: DUF364 domain-containing protein [Deltaproteobacteria bacterium]|jgi:uncharacterized protein (DUF4213/DUF364 family)|nr:DUF364 domain-containing protein [Deltaproteobacteria bacterium]
MTDSKNVLLTETAALVEEKLGPLIDELVVERAVFGLFFTGVKLSNGQGGLAFTPIKEIPEAVCCPSSAKAMPLSGQLASRPIRQYLADLNSPNVLKKALAIAVLNALSATHWRSGANLGYEILVGRDAFDEAAIPKNGLTVVIGALIPMLKRLISEGADFKVLERDPRALKPRELEHFLPADQAPKVVPQADLIVATGVTILNDTLPELLSLAKPTAEVIVSGPTASLLPDALFKRGVDALGGVLATDPDVLLNLVSEAGSGYHFYGKCAERVVIKKNKPS